MKNSIEKLTEFRYDLFDYATKQRQQEFEECREAGRKVAKQTRVVICGLARNIDNVLRKNIARIEKIAGMFADATIVMYENDSTDLTPYALKGWMASNDKVRVISEVLGQPVNQSIRCLERAGRMAHYRNLVRQLVANRYGNAHSHVIIVDPDLQGGWSYDGILNTFGQSASWDFVGSNGIMFRQYGVMGVKPCYYDVWAFRWPGNDKPCRPEEINPLHFKPGDPMVPVNSCFGGMGIYRMEAFKRCSYDGTDCEHVPFHRKMRESGMGRLYMNPSQITLYNRENFDAEKAATQRILNNP